MRKNDFVMMVDVMNYFSGVIADIKNVVHDYLKSATALELQLKRTIYINIKYPQVIKNNVQIVKLIGQISAQCDLLRRKVDESDTGTLAVASELIIHINDTLQSCNDKEFFFVKKNLENKIKLLQCMIQEIINIHADLKVIVNGYSRIFESVQIPKL